MKDIREAEDRKMKLCEEKHDRLVKSLTFDYTRSLIATDVVESLENFIINNQGASHEGIRLSIFPELLERHPKHQELVAEILVSAMRSLYIRKLMRDMR
jgi:hypothetical protein